MKVEKVFCIGRKYPEDFDKEIIDYLVNDYGCDRDIADIRLHNCLAFGWALCESPKWIVGIQTNYDRSEIKVGQWNGNFKMAVMIMIIWFKCEEESLMASLETGIKPIIGILLLLKTAIIR